MINLVVHWLGWRAREPSGGFVNLGQTTTTGFFLVISGNFTLYNQPAINGYALPSSAAAASFCGEGIRRTIGRVPESQIFVLDLLHEITNRLHLFPV